MLIGIVFPISNQNKNLGEESGKVFEAVSLMYIKKVLDTVVLVKGLALSQGITVVDWALVTSEIFCSSDP